MATASTETSGQQQQLAAAAAEVNCDNCDIRFDSPSSLQVHLAYTHDNVPPAAAAAAPANNKQLLQIKEQDLVDLDVDILLSSAPPPAVVQVIELAFNFYRGIIHNHNSNW